MSEMHSKKGRQGKSKGEKASEKGQRGEENTSQKRNGEVKR